MVMEAINVHYHDLHIGALSFNNDSGLCAFEYTPECIEQGLALSPIKMPLGKTTYSFPELDYQTFKGLPGLIADSLPDDFGNAVLNAWAAQNGKSPSDISPLQRLQYTGKRGMGALEYSPATSLKHLNASQTIELDSLVAIAQNVLNSRQHFETSLNQTDEDKQAMVSLLSVGTSAGGARPKAVVAFNQDFTQVRSGQTDAPSGFTHYLMKFDGVNEHRTNQETFGDPLGFGAMEYVYHLMAVRCGIDMMPCKLLAEGNRQHFVTQRFDRDNQQKIHIQTLNGIAHVDYRKPGCFSYAELFDVARQLQLSAKDAEQLLKRAVFNILARNHDDHSKNVSFMLKDKQWALAPAYDLAYSYKPGSHWVDQHWMSLNGKRDHFVLEDLYSLENISPLFTRKKIRATIEETADHLSQWRTLASEHAVPSALIDEVESNLRLNIV